MNSRLPESRLLSLRAKANEASERAFSRPPSLTEVFSSASALRGTNNRLVPLQIGDAVPLKTKSIQHWPEKTTALCLHCAESCPLTPLPAVKYYDAHEECHWVYGFFCRPCCALAHVSENPNTDSQRCLVWTQSVLRNYFGVENMQAAPPRAALSKFGGKMSLASFYGEDGTIFKSLHTPPFVTFAMYAEITNQQTPADSKIVNGLRRPLERTHPIATPEPTDKPPLILEFLAKRGADMKPKDAKEAENDVSKEKVKKRKKEIVSVPIVSSGGGGGLSQYLIK
jgi:hypothetical protein